MLYNETMIKKEKVKKNLVGQRKIKERSVHVQIPDP